MWRQLAQTARFCVAAAEVVAAERFAVTAWRLLKESLEMTLPRQMPGNVVCRAAATARPLVPKMRLLRLLAVWVHVPPGSGRPFDSFAAGLGLPRSTTKALLRWQSVGTCPGGWLR